MKELKSGIYEPKELIKYLEKHKESECYDDNGETIEIADVCFDLNHEKAEIELRELDHNWIVYHYNGKRYFMLFGIRK